MSASVTYWGNKIRAGGKDWELSPKAGVFISRKFGSPTSRNWQLRSAASVHKSSLGTLSGEINFELQFSSKQFSNFLQIIIFTNIFRR